VTRLASGLRQSMFLFPLAKDIFFLFQSSRPAMGPDIFLFNGYHGRKKRPGLEADHSCPSLPRLRMSGFVYPRPTCFIDMHGHKFTLKKSLVRNSLPSGCVSYFAFRKPQLLWSASRPAILTNVCIYSSFFEDALWEMSQFPVQNSTAFIIFQITNFTLFFM
jgi:hypothetical protein